MKPLTLSAFIVCALLIGILPKESGRSLPSDVPRLVSGAVSADGTNHPGLSGPAGESISREAAAGEPLFKRYCSVCHSVELVWKSGPIAREVDRLVDFMLEKDDIRIDPADREKLVLFMKSRLPAI
ncbi:MAG: cytochrome c [Candidatus Glassbacteria bacterium]